MASPVPGSMVPAMKPKPMRDPGTAPPWLRTSPPPTMTPPVDGSNGRPISDPITAFRPTTAPPTNGLASLGSTTAMGQQYGSTATDVATPMVRSTPNTSLPPVQTPPTQAGTPWDLSPIRGAKGSKTFDFDWDPDNPTLGGDAMGLMSHATFGAGAAPGSSLKMALRGADGKTLFDSGDSGSLANLTSGKLAKGKYQLAIDPSDPNAEWHMNMNKRGASYYDNGGVVSNPSATGWSGGTDPGTWDKGASAAGWDAGAEARWADQNANNEGYGGSALNPNSQNGHLPGAGSDVDPAIMAQLGGGNPAGRGAGTFTMPGATGAPGSPAAGGLAGLGAAAGAGGGAGAGGAGGATNWSTMGPQFTGLNDIDTDFTGAAARGADAAYKGATQFMDGDFAKEREAATAQLVAQGLQPGSEAFERQMERIERGQNAARTNAAFTAQGVGHSQAGDLLMRALEARKSKVGEQTTGWGLGLQDRGMNINDRNTNRGLDIQKDTTGVNASLALRRLGLDENSQEFQQLMQLIASSRGGVNMPNFGAPGSLDVTGANSIASGNANAAEGRAGADRAAWAQILGQLAGGMFK